MVLTLSALLLLLTQVEDKSINSNFLSQEIDKYLVSADARLKATESELKKQYSHLAHLVRNGYTAYRITYNTKDVSGKPIIASGAVFIPDIKNPLPVLNYNHGTYFPSSESKAPSYLSGWNPELAIGKLFSASGYLVILPDYVGYGSSKHLKHPYGAYNHIAATTIDMMYAVKELCHKQNISLSGKTFFSGWSEGAAVSLAVVKQLEEQKHKHFIPSATVANAGPYYTSAFVDHVLHSKVPLTYMSTYAWVLQSYNWVYNINKPYDYYFTQPAASNLQKNVESSISHDPATLFTNEFRNNFTSGKDIELKKAFEHNDLWNWKPSSKIVLCHGDKDDYVPLFNSEKAYKEMKLKGADVTLKVFKGHSHSSSAINYLEQAFITFESFK